MTVFLDTSVLVATFYANHEHHEPSIALFAGLDKRSGCTAAHCLAETYAVLTGMPGKDRASPDEALLFIGDVRAHLALVSLTSTEFAEAITDAAKNGTIGGGIYDAILSACARKAVARVLYTWNVKHFVRHGPDVAALVRRP